MISSYERISQKLLKNQPKPSLRISFKNGKITVIQKSLHKTLASRTFRTFLRIKKFY